MRGAEAPLRRVEDSGDPELRCVAVHCSATPRDAADREMQGAAVVRPCVQMHRVVSKFTAKAGRNAHCPLPVSRTFGDRLEGQDSLPQRLSSWVQARLWSRKEGRPLELVVACSSKQELSQLTLVVT